MYIDVLIFDVDKVRESRAVDSAYAVTPLIRKADSVLRDIDKGYMLICVGYPPCGFSHYVY